MRTATVALLLAAACALAGCGADATDATDVAAPPASPTVPRDTTRQDESLELVRAVVLDPTVTAADDDELVALLEDVCVEFDNGATPEEADIFLQEDINEIESLLILSSAVAGRCPENLDALNPYLKSKDN